MIYGSPATPLPVLPCVGARSALRAKPASESARNPHQGRAKALTTPRSSNIVDQQQGGSPTKLRAASSNALHAHQEL